jgi:hypothetical protein
MIDNDLQRAKEIFFQYACNHFHLDREVDAEEYKKFDISNEQEKTWTREYVAHWISQLSVDDLRALNCLRDSYAEEALPEMFRMSTLGDSFTKLSFANTIWDIAHGGMMSPILRERARQKAVSLWQSLLDNPIEFTDNHRKKVSEIVENQAQLEKSIQMARESRGLSQRPTTSQVTTLDEYILNYAKSKLRESKKRNSFHFLLVSFFLGIISVASVFIDLMDKIKRLGKGKR